MGKDLTSHGDANLRICHVSRVTHHASQRIGILALGIMLAGCLMPRATEGPVHTFLLTPENGTWAVQPSGNKHEVHGVLLLSAPQAEPGFDTRRMVYFTRPHEVSYYATNQWAETPARMIGTLLAETLEKSGLWRVVVSIPSSVRGDYRLDTQALVLQQEFLQRPSQVRVGFRLQLVDLHEQVVVGTRRFEVAENAPTDDAYGGVLAANRAVASLLDQVTAWVTSCMGEGSPGRC